jgi:lysophospholipase L1-like esterase
MRGFGWLGAPFAAMLLAGAVVARDAPPSPPARPVAAEPVSGWIASWGSAQMPVAGENALPDVKGAGVTVRQFVRLSAGGTRVRVRFSNAFGSTPLAIGAANIARPAGGAGIVPGSALTLQFAGHGAVTIPPGAELYSDPVEIAAAPGSDLAISLYLPAVPADLTGHPGARATSFVAAGQQVGATALANAGTAPRWWVIADVEVDAAAPDGKATLVAIGDSITDGYGVAPDTHARWTDTLARRLRADPATAGIGVVNAGIGGNRVLLDGLGPNLLARFDRDVVARSGVKWAILLEGVNDLGVLTREAPATAEAHAAIVTSITQAYAALADRAHAHGIALIAGTIMPFAGNDYYHPGADTERDRQAINRFIRTSGRFDAVIDFDRVMRDPARPDRLAPAYDSGDHLHPSLAGYKAMGEAIPLALFRAGTASTAAAAPRLALTFDDLPEHGPLPTGTSSADVVADIVAALKAAGVKAPHGFVNAARAATPDNAQAIAAWQRAGFPLGNHGFAHRDLATIDVATFERELTANEPVLRTAMRARDWHWFRYPFLSEGATPMQRDAARAVLRARGYRIAAVTMDFGDYAWNGAYARCVARADGAAIAELERSYLAAARVAAARSRAAAAAVYGRDIPYVLLMHVGAFDARMLPRLLALYRGLGFAFVPLEEAQSDAAYRASTDLTLPGPSVPTPLPIATAPAAIPLPDATICA